MLKNIRHKMKLKGNLTAIVWKEKQNVNIRMNIHSPSLEANFSDKRGKAVKPAIIQDYFRHMGYVENSDRIMNSYSISRQTRKWTKKHSSIFWTLPFSTALSFLPPVVQNYHIIRTDNCEGPDTRGREGGHYVRPQDREDKPHPQVN